MDCLRARSQTPIWSSKIKGNNVIYKCEKNDLRDNRTSNMEGAYPRSAPGVLISYRGEDGADSGPRPFKFQHRTRVG